MIENRRRAARIVVALIVCGGVCLAVQRRVAANAPPGRYDTSMGAGTVYDTATKLTWQQGASGALNWNAANTYCGALSLGTPASGWRLPTMKELQTIVDESKQNPALDPVFPSTPTSFWSSSDNANAAPQAWYNDFTTGGNAADQKSTATTHYARCVR